MAVANQCLSYSRFVAVRGAQSSPLQRKPLLFSFTLPSRSHNLYSSIVTSSSKKKNNKKNLTHVTEGNDEEDPFELLLEEFALLERELEGVLGEFDAELLNTDISETQGDSDVEKSSGDGNENSLNKLAGALKTGSRKLSKKLTHVTEGNDEKQLEEDLKNDDDLSKDDGDDDEISEEEFALLKRELEDLLGEFDAELLNTNISETQGDSDVEKSSGDGNENSLKLSTWQLNKLARALKTGGRKLSNAMISNIVHVSNIPRRTVIKWFEDKRAE